MFTTAGHVTLNISIVKHNRERVIMKMSKNHQIRFVQVSTSCSEACYGVHKIKALCEQPVHPLIRNVPLLQRYLTRGFLSFLFFFIFAFSIYSLLL